MKTTKLLRIDGSNIFVLDNLMYFDNAFYSHFYAVEDAYNYYKEIQEEFKKNIVFRFKEYELMITKNTTLEDIKKQLSIQEEVNNKLLEEEKETSKNNKINDLYDMYLILCNDIRIKTDNYNRNIKNYVYKKK